MDEGLRFNDWLRPAGNQRECPLVSVSTVTSTNFHAMPIPAAMLLGSAWLGREVAAIDGKSYQDIIIFWHILTYILTICDCDLRRQRASVTPLWGINPLWPQGCHHSWGDCSGNWAALSQGNTLPPCHISLSGSFRRSQLFLNHIFRDSRSQQLRLCQVNSEGSTHVKRHKLLRKARV